MAARSPDGHLYAKDRVCVRLLKLLLLRLGATLAAFCLLLLALLGAFWLIDNFYYIF